MRWEGRTSALSRGVPKTELPAIKTAAPPSRTPRRAATLPTPDNPVPALRTCRGQNEGCASCCGPPVGSRAGRPIGNGLRPPGPGGVHREIFRGIGELLDRDLPSSPSTGADRGSRAGRSTMPAKAMSAVSPISAATSRRSAIRSLFPYAGAAFRPCPFDGRRHRAQCRL